ncbi:unnamed protein product [Prorocentrum cordatum]|uniref:Autophagy-related protein 9 n=1 Tax=Prorocentrum cordatum TaxID=2364126 RepID=A0ABN9PR66_9DINO|nr:unnamed protein product [Polarella glacialis]
MTTGAALDHICLGSGMSTITSMDNYLETVSREAYSVVPGKAASLSCDAVDKALASTRKFLQDVLSVMNGKIQLFCFKGILFSALHLQLQVTYHYLRCAAYPSHCHSATRLWIGIAAATLSSGLMLFQVVVTAKRAWDVLTVWQRCKKFVVPVAEDFIQKGSHEQPERCATAISEIDGLQHELRPRLAALFVLSCMLVMLFSLAVSKMTMDQFVCEDHIWNFRLNYWSGCVSFSAWSNRSSL